MQLIPTDSLSFVPPPGEEDKYVLTKVNIENIFAFLYITEKELTNLNLQISPHDRLYFDYNFPVNLISIMIFDHFLILVTEKERLSRINNDTVHVAIAENDKENSQIAGASYDMRRDR